MGFDVKVVIMKANSSKVWTLMRIRKPSSCFECDCGKLSAWNLSLNLNWKEKRMWDERKKKESRELEW